MRDSVLNMLLDNLGHFVSGEDISRRLGITRAAVWKYIKLLQGQGYMIESSTKKGDRIVYQKGILLKAGSGYSR